MSTIDEDSAIDTPDEENRTFGDYEEDYDTAYYPECPVCGLEKEPGTPPCQIWDRRINCREEYEESG